MITHPQRYREKISLMISWGHWFTLFNILFALLLGSSYLWANDWPSSLLGRVYAWSSWIGHFSFIVFVTYLLLIFPLSFILLSQRLLRLICVVIATMGLTFILLDSMVFSYLHLHLNAVVWQLITNPEQGEIARHFQQIFIAVPLIFLLELLFATWSWQKLRSLQHRHFARPLITLFVLAFFASHLIYIWADANFYRPVTMQRANLPLSHPMTARRFLEKYGWLDGRAYQQRLIQQGNPDAVSLTYPLDEITFRDRDGGFNLLLITVDSLSYADAKRYLPSLERFAEENVQFSNYHSSGKTAQQGIFGLFYGISSSYIDSVLNMRTPSALLNALNYQRYQFNLFSSVGFNDPLFNYALLADYTFPPTRTQSDSATLNQWYNWLETRPISPAPWFSWLILKGMSKDNAQVTDLNRLFSDLIKVLQQRNILDNTVVIITANQNPYARQDGQIRREDLHIPLVIHWPGIPAQTIAALTNQNDLMVTLMQQLLRVTTEPSRYSQGEDLFASRRSRDWSSSRWNNELMIFTPQNTYLLNGEGAFRAWNLQNELLVHEKLQLKLLLQVLRAERRFIAN